MFTRHDYFGFVLIAGLVAIITGGVVATLPVSEQAPFDTLFATTWFGSSANAPLVLASFYNLVMGAMIYAVIAPAISDLIEMAPLMIFRFASFARWSFFLLRTILTRAGAVGLFTTLPSVFVVFGLSDDSVQSLHERTIVTVILFIVNSILQLSISAVFAAAVVYIWKKPALVLLVIASLWIISSLSTSSFIPVAMNRQELVQQGYSPARSALTLFVWLVLSVTAWIMIASRRQRAGAR